VRVVGLVIVYVGVIIGAFGVHAIREADLRKELRLPGRADETAQGYWLVGAGLVVFVFGGLMVLYGGKREPKAVPVRGDPTAPLLRWSIDGTYTHGWSTGPWAIEAPSAEEARRQAEALGIRVSAVTPVNGPDHGGTPDPGSRDDRGTS
jgi:hypothetical protein